MADERRSSRGGPRRDGGARRRGADRGRAGEGRGGSAGARGRGGSKGPGGQRGSGPKGPGRQRGGGAEKAGHRDAAGGSGRDGRGEQRQRSNRGVPPPEGRTRQWGGLARRGAARAGADVEGDRSGPGRARDARPGRDRPRDETPDEARERAERREAAAARRTRLEDEARDAVERARARGETGGPRRGRSRRPATLSPQSATTLKTAFGRATPKAERRLANAAEAFESERFADAQRILRELRREAPTVAEIRELLGLTYYRLGKWSEAITELEAFVDLTGDTDQHPVLADCHRALGRWERVDELWSELRDASPSGDVVTEGRIVAAGAAADRGDVARAVRMLEKGWSRPKRPKPHHLRRAYALADLYERSGEMPRARELFEWVAAHAPDLADVRARVANLR